MSQAEDLLNSLMYGVSTASVNPSTEGHIVIGDDRFITVPDELKRIAVQHDHNIETVTFDCPRYWDNHDMSQMVIYINYIRADGIPGSYPADNITIDDANSSIMHFDWTISRHVTRAKGPIVFNVCVKKTDSEGNESNHWNSELNKDAYISEGLEYGGLIEETYPDIISSILSEIDALRNASNNGGTGTPGVGIQSIEQTATSTEDDGNNVITVTLTDGTSRTFTVQNGSKGNNGVGVQSIEQTTTSTDNGGVNIVTVVLTDGRVYELSIRNGTGGTGALSVATPDILGGVKPVAKTDSMTQEVGIDGEGKLYTEPTTVSGNSPLPPVTESDNGKILSVVNGVWTAVEVIDGNSATF